jgi:hypothetical protein
VEPPRTGCHPRTGPARDGGTSGGGPLGAVGQQQPALAVPRDHRGEQSFARLLDILAPGNRSWAHAASALVLVAAQTVDDTGRPRPWALFDTGQAVAALSVQAEADGLSVHQMGGFDAESTRHEFELDAAMTPLVVIAVGRRDPDAELPETLAARERAPRTRHPLDSILLTVPEEPASRVA